MKKQKGIITSLCPLLSERRLRRSGTAQGLSVGRASDAAEEGYVRIIDESGEDYLYPEDYFVPIDVPRSAAKILAVPV